MEKREEKKREKTIGRHFYLLFFYKIFPVFVKAKRKEKTTVYCISSPFVLIVEDELIKIFVTFSMYSCVEIFLIAFFVENNSCM